MKIYIRVQQIKNEILQECESEYVPLEDNTPRHSIFVIFNF